MLKRVHDRFRRFQNDVCYHSRHDFLEVPLIVIPNLFRDRLIFQRPEGAKNETIDPVSPFFCSRLLVSNANSRIRSFSLFYSLQRSAGLGF